MGKASKKKSRRDNRGSRRSNDDLEHSNKKQSGEHSSIILTDLSSIDVRKRASAIEMFKDLLLQNLNNGTVMGKLTTNEILSSLSLRLIDSNAGVRWQAVKCFLAIVRSGVKFAERVVNLGIHDTIRRMLEEESSSGSTDNDDLIDDLLGVLNFLNLHCADIMGTSTIAVIALASSNLTGDVGESRRISFAEYLLNCSSSTSSVTAHTSLWLDLYLRLAQFSSSIPQLSHVSESRSDYLLVLVSAIMTNLLSRLPTITHSHSQISTIITILTESLHLTHPSLFCSSSDQPEGDGSMAVVSSDAAAVPFLSKDMGQYKTLSMKVTYTNCWVRNFST